MANYDNWLPMPEVIAATGMSQRTVYRMVSEGRLRQASRPIPGRRPLPVFDPAGVTELAQSALKAMPQILPPAAESPAESRHDLPPMEFWKALIEALKPRLAELPPVAESRQDPAAEPAESLAELRQKLVVTRQEALRLGFTAGDLAGAPKIRRGRYRMKDLENL